MIYKLVNNSGWDDGFRKTLPIGTLFERLSETKFKPLSEHKHPHRGGTIDYIYVDGSYFEEFK